MSLMSLVEKKVNMSGKVRERWELNHAKLRGKSLSF